VVISVTCPPTLRICTVATSETTTEFIRQMSTGNKTPKGSGLSNITLSKMLLSLGLHKMRLASAFVVGLDMDRTQRGLQIHAAGKVIVDTIFGIFAVN
jgi:hypothetical protein